MPVDFRRVGEQELRGLVELPCWNDLDDVPLISPGATEVRIGKFTFDLLARNKAGGVTIVEFKVTAWIGTLAQLLLYPLALRHQLERDQCKSIPKIRCVLVTSYLDRGVVSAVHELAPQCPVGFRVVIDEGQGPRLVDPTKDAHLIPEAQYWHQAEERGSDVRWDGQRIVMRGQAW